MTHTTTDRHYNDYVRALRLRAKVARIANMPGKSYRFRLGAILAADNRPGREIGARHV